MQFKSRICHATFAAVALLLSPCVLVSSANGQAIVAAEDFDGGAVNLIFGFNQGSNLTELPHRRFGIFDNDAWSIGNCAPFTFSDDSVADVSTGGEMKPYPADCEGIMGVDRDPNDGFFLIADASSFAFDPIFDLTVNWVFDVSSTNEDLTFEIDMGQLSNDKFDGVPNFNFILFEYRFDNGNFNTLFEVQPFELVGSNFSYRPMDSGKIAEVDFFGDDPNGEGVAGTHLGANVFGFAVEKFLADTGQLAPNTILDKALTANGKLDTFKTALLGNGSTLEIRMAVEFGFAALVFDNMRITTPTKEVLKGDVNLDGEINLLDIDPFILVLGSGNYQAEADTNCDGEVNLLDIDSFILLVAGGG